MGIVEQYFLQLKKEKRRWRRAIAILTLLSLFVASGVSWNLRMTGITVANGATCGREEHRHTDACPMEKVLICGYPDEPAAEAPTEAPTESPTEVPTEAPTEPPTEAPTEAPTEPPTEAPTEAPTEPPTEAPTEAPTEGAVEMRGESALGFLMDVTADMLSSFVPVAYASEIPAEYDATEAPAVHTHTDDCYQIIWLCEKEEHLHDISCYSDDTADIESAAIWEDGLPELTGDWAEDLVQVALSQLGCAESERNYQVADDTLTRKGITRYGQWYGNPYGDWSAMFVLFCLNYAEIPQEAVPWSPGVYNMMRLAQEVGLVMEPDDHMFQPGNLLFLDTDENENADRMLIVTGFEEETAIAIGGDWENTVAEVPLLPGDSRILGYINIRHQQTLWENENAETGDETVPEEVPEGSAATTVEPTIVLDVEFPEEGTTFILIAQIANLEADQFFWQWQYSADGNEPWIDVEGATDLVCELEGTEENFNRYYRLQGQRIPVRERSTTFSINRGSDDGTEEGGTVTSEAIAPFSIGKNNNVYTIDVYAMPVDANGNRIGSIGLTTLTDIRVNNTTKISMDSSFDSKLGQYHSAYFGSESDVEVDNIKSVWRYESGSWRKTYYLAYETTTGSSNNTWKQNTDNSISLYMRYIPSMTVTFASEDYASVTETVLYNGTPTLAEPQNWTRDGYTLIGWTINSDQQNVYTYEDLMSIPVTGNVTYTAKWAEDVTISFNLGAYTHSLYPVEPMDISYGTSISLLPAPIWQNNVVEMAFDGWYLNEEFTQQVTNEHKFYEDTVLYAKWSPKDEGYYVYFMDFAREGQVPLVLITYSLTEGQTAAPYTPGNAPEGKEWDGKWYLDNSCINAYNFSIPVSSMTDYLTGTYGRDLYLYPGTQDVCRAIFVTYGTKVDPVTVLKGGTVDLNKFNPTREGYIFDGWMLQDGTPVSGVQTLTETTTFYAKWEAGYVPIEAILRIENANDNGMTQAEILGTWYAIAGSQIRVNSTYTGSGDSRKGTHTVVCVLDGVEYPVYKNSALTQKATLNDVYATYFIYNNTGTSWTDEVNWDDVYTGGEVPYSTRPVSSAGDTIINFDYMRVRRDIVFYIPNNSSDGGFIDVCKLQQNGLITGSVTYVGTKPTTIGQNVSASGVSAQNISWSYKAATSASESNTYTLHNMKYGQRIYEVYPVGGSWLTPYNVGYHQYKIGSQNFSSRRQDLTSDFFSGSGRTLKAGTLTAEFEDQEYIALMYAVECLAHETPDFVYNGVGYKVNTQLCEVVKHTGFFSIKDLDGCEEGQNILGTISSGNNKGSYKYYTAQYNKDSTERVAIANAKIGDTSVYTLFTETYWSYYEKFNGVEDIETFAKIYIFYYDRLEMNIQFNFGYDSDGDGINETLTYPEIAFGERLAEYQLGMPGYQQHALLNREGYEFAGWLDANGFVLEAEDWASMEAKGDSENNTMIFIAKWEKISNNIVEYYEDRSSAEFFESHYFDDGELVPYPTMTVYPEGWVWQEYGEGLFQRFDWDVPMYGEYGVQEIRVINGEERVVNVIRIYGTWDESHTKVVYDPNAPQGGIPGSAPVDSNEYTIWQSQAPVASQGNTANSDSAMIFVGWKLDRDGVVYQPGDHVTVRWPRTMIFTAQWAKAEDVVRLRYDPNGGTPVDDYPNETGFQYPKNATALVWNNSGQDGSPWFTRDGYEFTGWNTMPDGSGKNYAPDSNILLTEPVTILYAQWEKTTYTLSVYKVDSKEFIALMGAEFGLYKQENGMFLLVRSLTTGVDGHITFQDMEVDTLYKLVEEKTPNGYATVSKEVFFRLLPDGSTVSLVFYDAEGHEISAPRGVTGEYVAGSGHLTLTVQNLRGYELPATGGIGTPIYMLCGLFLIFAPLVYGLSLMRKYERRRRK